MKPQKRNKKDRKAAVESKNKESTSTPATTPATTIDITQLDGKKENEPPKNIFIDMDSDVRTPLMVKTGSTTAQSNQGDGSHTQIQIKQEIPTTSENIVMASENDNDKPVTDSSSSSPAPVEPVCVNLIDLSQEQITKQEIIVPESPDSSSQDIEDLYSSLPQTITKLSTANGSEVFLLGTAHFSPKSVQDVEKVMNLVKPSAVILELCQERAFMLSLDEQSLLEQNKTLSIQKVRDAIREKGLTQGLIYVMFVKMSATITEKLGMAPGSEFRAGAREAQKIPGCNIVLGDRSLKVTIARAVNSISFWQKIKLLYQFLFNDTAVTQEDVEKCKEKDILEQLLKELAGEYPGFKRVLLDERNSYLAHSIYKYAQGSETSLGPQKIVAIVGIGHVSGIISNWGKTSDEEIRTLEELPKKSRTEIVVKKSIKYCSIMLLIYVGYRSFVPSSVQDSIATKLLTWR